MTQKQPLITDSYGASDRQLALPAGPSHAELMTVGVRSGPSAFRPPVTGSKGMGAVHLCEAHACRLPAENFWEGKKKSAEPRRKGGSPGGLSTS